MKTFISYDCASKSLAMCHVTVLTSLREDLYTCLSAWSRGEKTFDETNAELARLVNGWVIIHKLEVTDLIPGKKVREVNELDRTRALKSYLRKVDDNITATRAVDTVIVEHQPPRISSAANSNSTYVSMQLMLWYCDFPLVLIDPKRKNNITCKKVGSYAEIREKAKDNYSARKRHSKLTFEHLVSVFGWEKHLVGIPKKNMDDISDAVLQTLYVAFHGEK
jgi:Poxvirus A22 protein